MYKIKMTINQNGFKQELRLFFINNFKIKIHNGPEVSILVTDRKKKL